MKTSVKLGLAAMALAISIPAVAQQRDLDNFRAPDKRGINQFEAPKDSVSTFDGVHVRIGGASTIQFQALDHENSGAVPLIGLGNNFNLPTANLDLDVELYSGLRMHLRTYLSARHHPEAWVKGGYIQIDRLDFISEGFAEDLMKNLRFKIGHMENNYGDAHFRRTDNAMALYNPFVGNYIMDSFTTEVGAEAYYFNSGWLGMLGVSNGKLNQRVSGTDNDDISLLAKVGYDNQFTNDLRFRLTGSVYHTNQAGNVWLYGGDRAGSRYYLVLEEEGSNPTAQFTSGRFNPGFGNEVTAFMINPFVKYKGFEFFGTFETASGKRNTEVDTRSFTQLAGEVIYRFGMNEDFYVAARYNTVEGEQAGGNEIDINRFQLAGGWFMTKNIMAKLEYVNQDYNNFLPGDRFHDGKFSGVVVEAVISF